MAAVMLGVNACSSPPGGPPANDAVCAIHRMQALPTKRTPVTHCDPHPINTMPVDDADNACVWSP